MSRLVWIDGQTVDRRQLSDVRPCVVECVHTLDYRARRMERHLDVLRAAAEELFGFAPLYRAGEMECVAAELLARNRMTRTLSCAGRFGTLHYDVPPWEHRSSMTEQIAAVADRMVQMQGAEAAIRIDSQGMVAGRSWSPLFLVKDRYLFTPRRYDSAEYDMAVEAAEKAGLQLYVRPFSVRALDYADELFTVDSMGMTAYSRVGGRRLSSSIAAGMASCLE